jgi:filamentous hemagglutinin
MPDSDFFQPTHGNPSIVRSATPVSLTALQGDLENIEIVTPKAANISAGNDIRDIYYVGQNLNATDISSVSAGRDIIFSSVSGNSLVSTGLEQGGPGALIVQAGGSIDLGTSLGIKTTGNARNTGVLDSAKGSDLYVVAGSRSTEDPDKIALKSPDEIVKLIDGDKAKNIKGLREYGVEYSTLKSQGDAAGAQQRIDEARAKLIDPFFGGETYKENSTGTINMTSSQISTNTGKDNIYVMARSQVNVGKTTMILDKAIAAQKQSNTGIYTAKGGGINIFSGGDQNVNEARVMSFMGGNLTMWSDHGDINAGRGSKTAISASTPTLVPVGEKNPDGTYSQYQLVFNPPSVGSGIRTLTYSPNLGETPPESGDIYIFAPEGKIDAGEAGIAGNKLVLGATQILNARFITSMVASVGVPSSTTTISLGSLAGANSMAGASQMAAQTSALGGSKDKLVKQTNVVDQFLSRLLDVKVINFDTDEGFVGDEKKEEEKK